MLNASMDASGGEAHNPGKSMIRPGVFGGLAVNFAFAIDVDPGAL
jgi:hypothetical protein